jgi:hypothetical protein
MDTNKIIIPLSNSVSSFAEGIPLGEKLLPKASLRECYSYYTESHREDAKCHKENELERRW